MRSFLPAVADDLDIGTVVWDEPRGHPGRPWLLTNMVSSVDGAATVEGRSGALGGPADRTVFGALRGVADVVLVGAGTVRAERYGPPKLTEDMVKRREQQNRPYPRIAIVSGSLDIDLGLPVFGDPDRRPMVITHRGADPRRWRELEEVADVLVAGGETVDSGDAIRQLGEMGASIVLCEGGPSLLGQLHTADLVDEWCITIGPVAAAGAARRIATTAMPAVRDLRLDRLWEEDGLLFLRYLREG
jgi:riboflavin biosynthesis pyrimidine reductase